VGANLNLMSEFYGVELGLKCVGDPTSDFEPS